MRVFITGLTEEHAERFSEEERHHMMINWVDIYFSIREGCIAHFYLHKSVEVLDLGQHQRNVLYSRLAANYLPEIVNAFLCPPLPSDLKLTRDLESYGPYLLAMDSCHESGYLFKYMSSTSPIAAPGKCIPYVQANRILARAHQWEQGLDRSDVAHASFFHTVISNSVGILATTLSMLDGDPAYVPVNDKVASGLLPILERLEKKLGAETGGDSCALVAGFFRKDRDMISRSASQHAVFLGLHKCALPTCKSPKNPLKLRQCGRCALVLLGSGHLAHSSDRFLHL